MGLGELMSGDAPERQTAQLDPTSQGIIDKKIAQAEAPIENKFSEIDAGFHSGQDAYGGLVGGNNAIKQKYAGLLGNDLHNASFAAKEGARFRQVDQLKNAQSALMARVQIQNDIFAKNLEAQQLKESARAETLSSILGLAGAMGGMAVAKQNAEQNKEQPQKQQKPQGVRRMGSHSSEAGANSDYKDSLQGIGDFSNYA